MMIDIQSPGTKSSLSPSLFAWPDRFALLPAVVAVEVPGEDDPAAGPGVEVDGLGDLTYDPPHFPVRKLTVPYWTISWSWTTPWKVNTEVLWRLQRRHSRSQCWRPPRTPSPRTPGLRVCPSWSVWWPCRHSQPFRGSEPKHSSRKDCGSSLSRTPSLHRGPR